eukprot:CAMPEP_0184479384 /NCGR_PEP_ID=MMETSP0113_2-20130426/1133_1 /TAXON_ID=91329 /ORGANISM="Norrisiella sphaerica, Strain BC52" /LENGTH=176 /DNA_ID=CAMNT_0026857457 /DNA_START=156 /DNA_END=686 /DNA_ORIENTATION=+
MGLDVGDRYVGVAITDGTNQIAEPLKTILRKVERPEYKFKPNRRDSRVPAMRRKRVEGVSNGSRPLTARPVADICQDLKELALENRVAMLVVGLPNLVDGTVTQQSKKTLRFVEELHSDDILRKIPWYWQNEAYSTFFVRKIREGRSRSSNKVDKDLDARAAARILQSFLTQNSDY